MTTISIPQADFDSNKTALTTFLKQQNVFVDVDFEGSYASALVDILAYNTSINNFYKIMAVGETRQSTAKLRTNVIARAQDNGYIPKSFSSATAIVQFAITSNTVNRSAVVIPVGTVVTGSIDNRNFTFSTTEPVVTAVSSTTSNTITFQSGPVVVAEGLQTSDSFVYGPNADLFEITNQQVDTTSIAVSVIEDNSNPIKYSRSTDVVGIKPTDNVFFIRVAPSGNYSIYFGNGIVGHQPKLGSIVVVQYRISNGQLPNGILTFVPGQTIDGESNISLSTILSSQGGDVYESIDSIKFNGEQANLTQNRSTYESDFNTALKQQFSVIADVSVVGGETLSPPRYGIIQVTGVDKQLNNLTSLTKQTVSQFLQPRVPLGTRITFADANIIRLGIIATILTANQVTNTTKANIISQLQQYATTNLGLFGLSAIESRISAIIDSSDSTIIGNSVSLVGYYSINTGQSTTIAFNNPIASIQSQQIVYNQVKGSIKDINGILYVVDSNSTAISPSVGSVDYKTGTINITPLATSAQVIDLTIVPLNSNIISNSNTLIKLQPADITIQ